MVTKVVHSGVLREFGVQCNSSKCRFEVNFWSYKLILAHFEAGNKLYSMYTPLVETLLSVGLIVMPENWKKCQHYSSYHRR